MNSHKPAGAVVVVRKRKSNNNNKHEPDADDDADVQHDAVAVLDRSTISSSSSRGYSPVKTNYNTSRLRQVEQDDDEGASQPKTNHVVVVHHYPVMLPAMDDNNHNKPDFLCLESKPCNMPSSARDQNIMTGGATENNDNNNNHISVGVVDVAIMSGLLTPKRQQEQQQPKDNVDEFPLHVAFDFDHDPERQTRKRTHKNVVTSGANHNKSNNNTKQPLSSGADVTSSMSILSIPPPPPAAAAATLPLDDESEQDLERKLIWKTKTTMTSARNYTTMAATVVPPDADASLSFYSSSSLLAGAFTTDSTADAGIVIAPAMEIDLESKGRKDNGADARNNNNKNKSTLRAVVPGAVAVGPNLIITQKEPNQDLTPAGLLLSTLDRDLESKNAKSNSIIKSDKAGGGGGKNPVFPTRPKANDHNSMICDDATILSVLPTPSLQAGVTTAITDCGVSVTPDAIEGSTRLPNNYYYSSPEEGGQQGLAVAIAVMGEDDDDDEDNHGVMRVYGVEYDPDAKPAFYMNRRFRLYALLACIVLLAVVGGTLGSVLLTSSNSSSTTPLLPTSAPTSSQERQYYHVFSNAVGNDLVFQDGTPHKLAADWIIHVDPMRLPADSNHVVQRYLLVLFYYQMSNNGKSPWRSCNPPPSPPLTTATGFNNGGQRNDTCVLWKGNDTAEILPNGTWILYFEPQDVNPDSAPGSNDTHYYRWLSGAHECRWAGITCDDDNLLRAMDLNAQNLTGTLPTELTSIAFLQSFSAPFNLIEGTIPTIYASIRHLVQLALHFNLLTGSISETWYHQATALLTFNLAGNMLTGSLTSQLTRLSNLKGLHLFQNHLTGTIPTEIGELTNLAFTQWYGNRLGGTIPTEIGRLTRLEQLWISGNNLTATIPSEIGLMTMLTELLLNDNKLSGPIPEELYNLNLLQTNLDLSDMLLSGTLSTKIGNLTRLQYLYLRRNHLSGTVPTELALLTDLRLAWLHNNNFSGPIPQQICDNQFVLEVLQADCAPADNPAQVCSCCSACCDRSTSTCKRVSA